MTPLKFARFSSLLLVALGVASLLGWAFDILLLKSVFPGLVSMKPNTGATLVLCGTAMALLTFRKASKQIRRITAVLAIAAIGIGALTLMEYLFGWELRIDQLVFNDDSAAETLYPGRMSPSTALCFVFAGSALLVASLRTALPWRWPVLSALGSAVALVGGMALAAYVVEALLHFHLWNYTGIAVHTAVSFLLLGAALLAMVRSEGGLAWSLDRSITAGISIGVASVLIVAIISNNFTYRLRQDDDWVAHTQEVLKEISAVAQGMDALESDQRGYVILGNPHFLDTREQTKEAVRAGLQTLQALTADNPAQQLRLQRLAPLLVQRNLWGDRVIAVRHESGFPEAEQLLAVGTGINLSAAIQHVLKDMSDAEDTLLVRRREQSTATSTRAFLLLPLGLFLSITMLSLVLFFLNAGVGERLQDSAVLRQQASLLDLAPVLVCDMDSRIVSWSSGVEKLFGYHQNEALGHICHHLLNTAFTIALPLSHIEKALHTDGRWEGELIHRAKDGSEVIVASQWVLYRDAHGEPNRILEVNTDVTARKRAEVLQLRSQKLESLGTLSGGIAHDFNNMLLAINGNAKFAIGDLPPDHPAQRSLAEIAKAGARASELVRRILAFSQPQESRRAAMQLQPVVEEALHLVRATLPASVEFRTHFAPGLPNLIADATQIHQVIVNLATNAVHAIGPNSGFIEFRLGAENVTEEQPSSSLKLRPGLYLRLDIIDSGSGIERAILDRIFDPFFTTKGPGEGTGLGLSVVHGIMKSHGGAIGVYSEPEKGTAFHLYFPASDAALASTPAAAPEAHRGKNEHILYVDDEQALVDLIDRTLTRLGYRVSGYVDAALALQEFRSRPRDFDAVVTDLSMPGLSGFDLAAAILAIRPEIPIVMTSGYVRPEDQERALRMGLRDLILKPDTIKQLGSTLNEIFHQMSVIPDSIAEPLAGAPSPNADSPIHPVVL